MSYTIEDVLVQMHSGQWFTWSDSKNKVYENIVVLGGQDKPTQEFLESELARLQAEQDSTQYQRDRATAYAPLGDQLDMQYHDLQDSTTTWADHVAEIKARFPK